MMRLTLTVVVALALAACGGGGASTTSTSSGAPASGTSSSAASAPAPSASESTPSLPASLTSDDPKAVAQSLQQQIPEIVAVVQVTEANDSNDLIGRPGKYDAASFMKDKRLTCSAKDYKDLDTSCGAKIERWPSKADAQARADYIQAALKAMPILGTEYDYVRGGLLLRVAGHLKPSQAKQYEKAFVG